MTEQVLVYIGDDRPKDGEVYAKVDHDDDDVEEEFAEEIEQKVEELREERL